MLCQAKIKTFYIDKISKKKLLTNNVKTARKMAIRPDKIREIHHFGKDWNKAINTFNRQFNQKLEENNMFDESQFGFRQNIGVIDAVQQVKSYKYYYSMDLKDAFHQNSSNAIYKEFKRLGIPRIQAYKLALICTPTGMMFQGNPIAPTMLNLLFKDTLAELKEALAEIDMHGKIIQYADDITIASNVEFTEEQKLMFRLIITKNWKLAKGKTNYNRYPRILGVVKTWRMLYKKATLKFVPLRTIKKRLAFFKRLKAKGITTSRRPNKNGVPIAITAIIQGLENWLQESLLINNSIPYREYKYNLKLSKIKHEHLKK